MNICSVVCLKQNASFGKKMVSTRMFDKIIGYLIYYISFHRREMQKRQCKFVTSRWRLVGTNVYIYRTTLARWRAAQLGEHEKHKKRRPYLASDCKSLYACEKWRMQIIREIAKKVAQIQNAGLGEFRIRDLNDEINKLLREKRHWEAQIKELGGPDYQKVGPRMLDHEGKEVPGNRGYKYFGAAKELPGENQCFCL